MLSLDNEGGTGGCCATGEGGGTGNVRANVTLKRVRAIRATIVAEEK